MTNQAQDSRTLQESEDDGPSSPMRIRADHWRPRWHQLRPRAESPGRYLEGAVLGEGGMGVVRLVQDLHLDRSVAMKSIKGERGYSSTKRERFLREVWVQGQLEHPAIVPIYDVFRDARGSLFFTMKPVSGETLDEIFRNLRAGTREVVSRYSTRRLLTAFVQVCMAVHHAHTRGISHRDIKPANIILGESGEVYLLDWGIAKVENGGFPSFDEDGAVGFVGTPWNQTSEGMLLGTPGYMAPEQASGETDRQGPPSDVYSLGAILYEIVMGSPLHQPKPYESLEESTVRLRSAAIEGARSKKVPPDLEELWLAALVTSPEERHLSARALGQGIERFLDKAWDADRRREVASEHAEQAAAAAQRALADSGPSQAIARKLAMEELGKAMALDPANRQALDVLATLVSQPPTEVPEEVARELESLEEDSVRKALDVASKVDLVGALLMIPLMLSAESWSSGYSAIFILTLLVLSSFLAYLRKKTLHEVGAPMNVGIIFMCCAILLWVACSFGSPIGTWPLGVLMVICGLMAILLPMRAIFLLPLVVAGGMCVLGGHLSLESLGYIPKTVEILSPTEMVVYARQFAFQTGVTVLSTLAGSCLLVAINTTAIFVFRRQSAQAKRQLQMMSWQIRQLVPAVEHEAIRPSIRPQGRRERSRFSEP